MMVDCSLRASECARCDYLEGDTRRDADNFNILRALSHYTKLASPVLFSCQQIGETF